MKVYYCLVLLLFWLPLQAGELYKVVNKDGSITYTDIPQEGAQSFNMSSTNTAIMPSMTAKTPGKGPVQTSKKSVKRLPNYAIKLISPTPEQTIRNNLGKVSIRGEMTPAGAGQFQLFLDSVLIETKATPSFDLENVERGEHSIQIKFLHNSGKILASTPEQVFYLHKASVLINKN